MFDGFSMRLTMELQVPILLLALGYVAGQQTSGLVVPKLSTDAPLGVVKSGAAVVLTCDTPSTDVKWFHDGTVIQPSQVSGFTIREDSRTLLIGSFRQSKKEGTSHLGVYRCYSVNDRLFSNQITLIRARIKDFSDEDKDIVLNVTAGNTVIIPCAPPLSHPAASTVFERNGTTTIDESNDHYLLLESGDLQISPVSRQDNGVYRCVAINPVTGSKVSAPSTVRLDVHAPAEHEPVDTPIKGRRLMSLSEGSSITLPCVMHGNPVPTITWNKYGGPLPENRTEKRIGSLVIKDLLPSDEGTYQCLGENGVTPSPKSVVYIISVLAKPVIELQPRDVTTVEGDSVSLACPVQEELVSKVTTDWYFNGVKIIANNQDIVLTATGALVIKSFEAKHAGVYQCFVSNEVAEDSAFAVLRVAVQTTSAFLFPPTALPPGDLVAPSAPLVTQVRNIGVLLTWMVNDTSRILSFQIRGYKGNQETQVARDIPRQARTHEINGLEVGVPYMFSIVAVYRNRQSAVGERSNPFLLDPNWMSPVNPTTARSVVVSTAASLSTGRSSIKSIAITSSNAKYASVATHTNTMTLAVLTRSQFTSRAVMASTDRAQELLDIVTQPAIPLPLTQASIRISLDIAPLGIDSRVKGLSSTSVPPPYCGGRCQLPNIVTPPQNVSVTVGNSFALLCLSDTQDSTMTWYKDNVQLHPIHSRLQIAVEGSTLSISKVRKDDSGWYMCEASNSFGSAFASAAVTVLDDHSVKDVVHTRKTGRTTVETATKDPSQEMVEPSVPEVKVISRTEVQIEWIPITSGVAVDFYKIQYKQLGKKSADKRDWLTVDGVIQGTTKYKVTNLRAGASYQFRIAAVYINHHNKLSGVSRKITLPASPAINAKALTAPRLVAVRQAAPASLHLKWLYYEQTAEMFIIQYMPEDDVNWIEKPVYSSGASSENEWEAALDGLQKNVSYIVQVVAVNAAGRSEPSNNFRRRISDPFVGLSAVRDLLGEEKTTPASRSPEGSYSMDSPILSDAEGSNTLYLILGSVLGSVVLLVVVFVAICGYKQRQHRRASLASNKFADPARTVYNERMKLNGPAVHSNGSNYIHANGSITKRSIASDSGSQQHSRMSLNINPLDEIGEPYQSSERLAVNSLSRTGEERHARRDREDYNLTEHYPHYHSASRAIKPQHSLKHHSRNNLDCHQATGFSHNSLPLSDTNGSRPESPLRAPIQPTAASPHQFSTFLPRTSVDSSNGCAFATQGARVLPYPAVSVQVPASDATDVSSHKRKRRKRSSSRRADAPVLHYRENSTNTDQSSGEGTNNDEEPYSNGLPPPPTIPAAYELSEESMP